MRRIIGTLGLRALQHTTPRIPRSAMAQEALQIRTEEDAWHLLQLWISEGPLPRLSFGDWPILNITVNGEQYHSSLRSSQMDALNRFQTSMGRAYAAIAHGVYDKRRLRQEEEEQLEFTTTIKEGSSVFETDLTPLVSAVAQVVTEHPTEALIAAVLVALALISRPMVLKIFENKAKQMENEDRQRLIDLVQNITLEDRRKIALFDAAMDKLTTLYPTIDRIIPDLSSSYWRFASASANAEHVEIGNVKLTQDQLEVLSERRSFRSRMSKVVTDDFLVEGVTKVQNNYRVLLKSDTYHLSAIYGRPNLSLSGIRQLLGCVATSNRIHGTVEIRHIDKAMVVGRLRSFSVLTQEAG